MTITAMAKQFGVSTVTVYRRLQAKGVNLDDLRDGKELSQYGQQVIASLFDGTQPITDSVSGMEQGNVTETELAEMAVKVASLSAQVNGLQALVAQLEGERDALREQLATVTAALEREQTDRQQERLLLTDGKRSHWWSRLFGK